MSDFRDYYDTSKFSESHLEMLQKINELGPKFAERSVLVDLNAQFPTENYQELAEPVSYTHLTLPTNREV